MSYTNLYTTNEDGNFGVAAEFRNSWGSAAFIWSALARTYGVSHVNPFKAWERVWTPDFEARIEPFERLVLHSTYDRAVLRKEDFERMAEAMETFAEKHDTGETVCSLRKQAEALRTAKEGGAEYAAWNQTSVSESLWWLPAQCEHEEERPYNIHCDSGHRFIDTVELLKETEGAA